MYKKFFKSILLILLISSVFLVIKNYNKNSREVIFQTSTLEALLDGAYDGEMTYKQLKKHGDFGLGTFNGLDGEMIALDGDFYKINAQGKVSVAVSDEKTPFAVVTYFDSDQSIILNKISNIKELKEKLDSFISNKYMYCAIKIDGVFDYVKTRSVPKQEKPYPKLLDVIKNQPIFEKNNVRGSIVGFRGPEYIKGINVSGYHFHFISDDRKFGGHLLECNAGRLDVYLDFTSDFFVNIPDILARRVMVKKKTEDESKKVFQMKQ